MLHDRNYSLDTIRTIATAFVILIHVCAPIVIKENFSGSYFWTANLLDSFSRASVPIFIMISGHFLLNSDLIFFYKKRLNKILIPLLFWSFIYLAYNYLPLFLNGTKFHFSEIVEKILYGKPYYHLWYVYMIASLYLITPYLKSFLTNKSLPKKYIIIFFLFIIGATIQYICYKFSIKSYFFFQFVEYLGYYLLGGIIFLTPKINSWLLVFLYVLGSLLTAIFTFYFRDFYFYEYLSISVIISSIFIFKLFSQLKIKQNGLSKLSKYSFGVYLVHPFVLNISRKLNLDFSLLGMLFFCVLISFLLTYLISNMPYLKRTI